MKTVKLDDLSLKVSSGLTPLRSNKEFWDNGTIPWLKTEQLGEKYIFDTIEYVSQTAINKTALKVFPENTLSIAMYGEGKTRGNVSIIKKPMTTNQACCNVELDKEKADYEYVYYFLKTQYEGLRSLSSGVRKNLNSNDIKNYPIRLPENIEEQRKIASILSTLDEKIALNNQINATLEQMAKTLYDYWFVQFDFPDDNGKPYKSSGGEMVYNETLKREIPKNWVSKTLGEIIIHSNTGLNPRDNFKLGSGDNYYITIKNIKNGQINFDSSCDRVSDDALLKINRRSQLDVGDILFTSIEPVGQTVLIHDKPKNWDINESVFSIRPDINFVTSEYLYMLLSGQETKGFTKNSSTGSIHKGIRHSVLKTFTFPYANTNLILNFTDQVKPILTQINVLQKENSELTKLRDWLLPMLMNGQVTVQ